MSIGYQEGQVWPLALNEYGVLVEVPLPAWRVARHLARLDPEKRRALVERLVRVGPELPCAVRPSTLFAEDGTGDPNDKRPRATQPSSLDDIGTWRRRTVQEQIDESVAAEAFASSLETFAGERSE